MKIQRTQPFLISLFIPCVCLLAALPTPQERTLSWTYPSNELSTGTTFQVFMGTNLAVPITNWTVITNMVGTSTAMKIMLVPGNYFFAVRATNLWGVENFSEVAEAPYPPRDLIPLRLR
jgi:hypothetical protein